MLILFDQDMAMNNYPDSYPFSSDSQPIKHSGLEGHFGLQPQAPTFVGRQILQEYKRDCPSKNDAVAHPGSIVTVHHPSLIIF